jgi:hypothetical protein
MSTGVAGELNNRWKHADRKMMTTVGNWSDESKVAESVPVRAHVITILAHSFVAKSGSEQVILGRPRET